MVVTLDGGIHPPGTPLLFADDLAAVRGDGVFETLLVRAGGACLVEAHLRRLSYSAKLMDLPEPDLPGWRRAIDVATRQWAVGTADEGAMRLVYSRGRERASAPTAYVTVSPVADRVAAARSDGVAAVTLPRELPSAGVDAMPWLLAGAKTLSYAINMAALRHAARQGAGDVIFISSDGYVLEGPRSTVVIAARDGGTTGLLTPPP
ncbi:MAG: aminodeoxychorismate lyase, partial [Mycobacterium sp.]